MSDRQQGEQFSGHGLGSGLISDRSDPWARSRCALWF